MFDASVFCSLQAPSVIEISETKTECEDEMRPSHVQLEEKAFISGLHSFMKERGSPIERIPHLGFKQSEFIIAEHSINETLNLNEKPYCVWFFHSQLTSG